MLGMGLHAFLRTCQRTCVHARAHTRRAHEGCSTRVTQFLFAHMLFAHTLFACYLVTFAHRLFAMLFAHVCSQAVCNAICSHLLTRCLQCYLLTFAHKLCAMLFARMLFACNLLTCANVGAILSCMLESVLLTCFLPRFSLCTCFLLTCFLCARYLHTRKLCTRCLQAQMKLRALPSRTQLVGCFFCFFSFGFTPFQAAAAGGLQLIYFTHFALPPSEPHAPGCGLLS